MPPPHSRHAPNQNHFSPASLKFESYQAAFKGASAPTNVDTRRQHGRTPSSMVRARARPIRSCGLATGLATVRNLLNLQSFVSCAWRAIGRVGDPAMPLHRLPGTVRINAPVHWYREPSFAELHRLRNPTAQLRQLRRQPGFGKTCRNP